jgi:hypothetical protein
MLKAAMSVVLVELRSEETPDKMPAKSYMASSVIKSTISTMMVSMATIVTPICLYVFEFKLVSKIH